MANSLGNNGGRLFSFGAQPVLIDCNFVVDQTNGNGYGIRSLKGQGVQNVYMATSAYITGTTHTGTNSVTSISQGTSSLEVGMPVAGQNIPAGTTIASIVSSSAITLSANTSTGESGSHITYTGVGNPIPLIAGTNAGMNAGQTNAIGYAWVQLSANYNRYLGGFSGFVSPPVSSAINIDASDAALTPGKAYTIYSVGHAAAGTATIAPVADVSGSLASTYFVIYDAYGNTFVIFFVVSGVGSAPLLGNAAPYGVPGLHYVQQSINTNDSAATIGEDLVVTIENLPSGISGVNSFTASGSSTVTIVNTNTNPYHLPGVPTDGVSPLNSGFTFALTVNDHNLADWQGVGLPKGLTPTVNQSFIAKATGFGQSTGQVFAAGVSGANSMEVIGDPNQSISPSPQGGSPNVGGWILVQCLAPTPTTVDDVDLVLVGPNVPTAPTNNSVIGMSFYVDARLSPSNIGD